MSLWHTLLVQYEDFWKHCWKSNCVAAEVEPHRNQGTRGPFNSNFHLLVWLHWYSDYWFIYWKKTKQLCVVERLWVKMVPPKDSAGDCLWGNKSSSCQPKAWWKNLKKVWIKRGNICSNYFCTAGCTLKDEYTYIRIYYNLLYFICYWFYIYSCCWMSNLCVCFAVGTCHQAFFSSSLRLRMMRSMCWDD